MPPELARRVIPAGEPGFGSDREPPLAAGSVTGYRWWAVADISADGVRNPGPLRGMHAAWAPGENTAVCLDTTSTHGAATVPDAGCYCGFYAFWELPSPYSVFSVPGLIPVCGAIEGYGKVILGSRGFRCARAGVMALHVPDAGLPPDLHEAVDAALEAAMPAVRVCRRLEDMLAEYPPSRP